MEAGNNLGNQATTNNSLNQLRQQPVKNKSRKSTIECIIIMLISLPGQYFAATYLAFFLCFGEGTGCNFIPFGLPFAILFLIADIIFIWQLSKKNFEGTLFKLGYYCFYALAIISIVVLLVNMLQKYI